MCNGSIMDKLISFALPLMLSGILQLMFNAVDIVVVGRFSGSQSLAAVGCRTDFADIQNKKECGGNRQWQRQFLRKWAANTKGKAII